jgi:tetratricopeptide (TPR) repeat protein
MNKIFSLVVFVFLSTLVWGQTNYEKFKKFFRDNDTVKVIALLKEWENSNPDDPELYTSAFNYYYSKSKQELISVGAGQTDTPAFQLTDSAGNVVGYLNSDIGYDPETLTTAFYYVDKGIEKFPNRLDIRFGKCYVLEQIEDYNRFTKEIIKTIEYSVTIHNNWLWTENKKLDEGANFMLGSVQDYLRQLYDTENDSLLENMKQIGETAIKYYPDNVEILSTTAVANVLTKNYDKALEYLKHAEQINPKDFIVLNNIANTYKFKGDKTNAIKYYQLCEKYGDEQAKQDAQKNIKELKQ